MKKWTRDRYYYMKERVSGRWEAKGRQGERVRERERERERQRQRETETETETDRDRER